MSTKALTPFRHGPAREKEIKTIVTDFGSRPFSVNYRFQLKIYPPSGVVCPPSL
jgi:hypothetical protein